MTALVVKVLFGVMAVGLGIWLGMPSKKVRGTHDKKYLQELENTLGRPGRTQRAKRHFTPLDLLKRHERASSRRRRSSRSRFSTVAPRRRGDD